jgi:KUP system potassium uptake protein
MTEQKTHAVQGGLGALAFGALGVVFGDIGTSPLYTLQACTTSEGGAAPGSILGVLSLIFWALVMVVTVKYLTFVMRADNHGEGGILALLALLPVGKGKQVAFVAFLVIVGAALLFGDGIITPAISVLSAMEGLGVATDKLKPAIVPLTCLILLGLFAIQRKGTGAVGRFFGPVMLVWFLTIGTLGAWHIAKHPSILRALSPSYGIAYFTTFGWKGFSILGIVVLAVTGGEALYADMGHFGPRPIRVAWLVLAFPALVLAYFGQGALLLAHPDDAAVLANPFFAMVPEGLATYALVALSACATIIASQALISGAFSLTNQAVQLGYFPRVTVTHTSRDAEGQIYVPEINWGLAIACIVLVLAFKESARLAAAYGIAVSGTMGITSIAYFAVTRSTWKWPMWKALPLLVLFLSFDLPFFAANLLKFLDGGWVPVLVASGFLVVMTIWRRGRHVLYDALISTSPPLDQFIADVEAKKVVRVPGFGIFMSSLDTVAPPVLVHHVSRIRCLPAGVLLLTIEFEHSPAVPNDERLTCKKLPGGFSRVVARFGFMEKVEVPLLLARATKELGLDIDLEQATYYLGHETFLATSAGEMGAVTEGIYAFLSRNARSATSYFSIPHKQVVELGTQLDL